jgi:hypothetical protein
MGDSGQSSDHAARASASLRSGVSAWGGADPSVSRRPRDPPGDAAHLPARMAISAYPPELSGASTAGMPRRTGPLPTPHGQPSEERGAPAAGLPAGQGRQ